MARRKLSAIPWGPDAPGIEIINGISIFVLEIDDITGIIYANGQPVTTEGASVDLVQFFPSSGNIIMVSGAGGVLALCTGGSGAGTTIQLPQAINLVGQKATIKKVDAGVGSVMVAPFGGDTIDGQTGYLLTGLNQFVVVESDGTNWQIVGNN